MKIENKKVKTTDEFILDALIYTPEKFSEVIIMLHGYTGCKRGRTPADDYLLGMAKQFAEKGFKVIQFDWRGHGDSTGQDRDVCLTSFYNDLDAVMKAEAGDLPFSFWGFSLGCTAGIRWTSAAKKYPKKCVFWSPVINPQGSFFEFKNSAIYSDISQQIENGDMDKNGYIQLQFKGWKIGKQFVDEARQYKWEEAFAEIKNKSKILILQGGNDVLVDKTSNIEIAGKYDIPFEEIPNVSHALFEALDVGIPKTIDYICN